jgi:uncharacterized protein (DUF1499 family)
MNRRQLEPCPHKPNCVSSLSDDAAHAVAPLRYRGDWRAAKHSLVELIENTPRAEILENRDQYVHAIFKTKFLGFIDDVEFVFNDIENIIHIRSASRVGYYDFGANRRRVESLRETLEAAENDF